MSALFRSRKFLTLLLDVVVSLATYFVGKYAMPEAADDILMVIAAMQPVVLAVIASWAIEDAADKLAGTFPH